MTDDDRLSAWRYVHGVGPAPHSWQGTVPVIPRYQVPRPEARVIRDADREEKPDE
jgi:hypothetical protein